MLRNDCFFEEDAKEYWDYFGEKFSENDRYVYIEIEGYTCKLNNDTTIEVALDLDEVTLWNDERVMSEIEEYVEVA